MKLAALFLFVFQFSTYYCAELVKDVIYLPSSKGVSSEKTPIKKSSSSSVSSTIPKAWVTGDINKNPLRSISVCTWVKSLDQLGTGTVFAYVTLKERVEFGLVGINTKETNKDGETPHDMYVVVKGKKSKLPIDLGLDDVRWHHICVTWSSRYGLWKVFKDGQLLDQGNQMKRGRTIAPGGRYYIGGGIFQFVDEEKIVNGSDISEHEVRVSTGFRTVRKKRNVVSMETKRMIGKFTDFYVWKKIVSRAHVSAMAQCGLQFRDLFNKEVKSENDYSNIFGTARRRNQRQSSSLSWAARNVVYAWSIDTITLQRPASLELSGDLCGYPITIECETNRMLISVDVEVSDWYNAQEYDIHLADHDCVAEQKGNFLVFHLPSMETCGTTREVIDNEVHYTNYISNSPRTGDVYVGQLFRAKAACKFPLDVSTSVSPIVPGKPPEVVAKTPVTNPVNGKPELEGVFLLSTDDKFTDPLRQGNPINSGKTFWGGIYVQGTYFNSQDEDVNVVVDECWLENEDQRSAVINQQGCNGTGHVVGNGEGSNVRMQFSPDDLKENTPTFVGCSFHPCVGNNCTPNCEEINNRQGRGGPRRRQRDVVEDEVYEVRIGPFVAREEVINITDDDKGGQTSDKPSEGFLLAIILPSAIIFVILVFTVIGIIYCYYKRSRQIHNISKRRWSDRGSKKSKHPIRTQSFTFCRPNYSAYNIYPPSFYAVRAKLRAVGMNNVAEETEQNTNTMISTVN